MTGLRSQPVVVSALGITQIFAWGTSYYLLAVLAVPIAKETGWPISWSVGGVSLGLLVAGLISPRVGRSIARYGGRPVLMVSAVLLALGLGLLSLATSLPAYALSWGVIGLGMGTGLYDPAFATLGKLYGARGRGAITTLTLFGGFASTVCWPLSAMLEAHFGWRVTCQLYMALQLFLALPIYVVLLPKEDHAVENAPLSQAAEGPKPADLPAATGGFALLAMTITLSAMISTAMSVHVLTVLQAKGLPLAAAVGLAALVGPSQVGARAMEMAIARFHHPIWTKIVATALVTAGLACLWLGGSVVILALVFYGAGIGLESIARGTLPLAMFGPERYPVMMGRIAMPSLIAQAAAPSLGALVLDGVGPSGLLALLGLMCGVNLSLVGALFLRVRAKR